VSDEARDVLPQQFGLDREDDGGTVVLTPRGELDIATAGRLTDAAEEVPSGTALLVVDLRAVTFMDSSGLRGLLLVRRRAQRDDIELLVCHDPVVHGPIFQLTQLQDDLPLVDADGLSARLAAR
jgi:anti-sigma B factor antagonist